MRFNAPANVDDLADSPQLREQFLDLWNLDTGDGFMGNYVNGAAQASPNYVDPRVEPPAGDPVSVPWNGFPRLLSRWFDDENSIQNKEKAEAVADIPTPILSWVAPQAGRLRLFHSESHRVPAFGNQAVVLARPLRYILPDGSIGPELHRARRQQDEYLEWHASVDANGNLTALTFTAEPPDYWLALAQVAPGRVLKLYKDLVSDEVQMEDLFHPHNLAAFGIDSNEQQQWFSIGGKGEYNPLNRWTTTDGIVHLTHRANTLGAEVTLAADASKVWASDHDPPPVEPNPPAAEIRRIACGSFGGINRSSDPLIGAGVGATVAGGRRITLTDPVGLYIATVNVAGLLGPQGQPVQALRVVRGQDDPFEPRILRCEIRLLAGTPFGLHECTLDGRPLRRGGQVARNTTVHLFAQTYAAANLAVNSCEGRVCRHADRSQVFLIGSPLPAEPCPPPQDLSWLSQTPYEGVAVPIHEAVGVAPQPHLEKLDLAAAVATGPALATSRKEQY